MGIGPRPCRVRPRDLASCLPGDVALRAEGWAKESRIDQGQELACEVSSDAVTKIKRFALANNYYNHYRDCSPGRALLSRPL